MNMVTELSGSIAISMNLIARGSNNLSRLVESRRRRGI